MLGRFSLIRTHALTSKLRDFSELVKVNKGGFLRLCEFVALGTTASCGYKQQSCPCNSRCTDTIQASGTEYITLLGVEQEEVSLLKICALEILFSG